MGRVLGEFGAALPDRRELCLQDVFEPPLEHVVAKPASAIPRLELVDGVAVFVEGIEIGENDVAFHTPDRPQALTFGRPRHR